jgi:hypothetical protein
MDERMCFACHHQGVPILALTTARSRGFAVLKEDVQDHVEYVSDHFAPKRELYRKGPTSENVRPLGVGYALATLEWGSWKADRTTEALVEYLLLYEAGRDHWSPTDNRPPLEGSHFTTTYFALRALLRWGTPAQKPRIDRRAARARSWLLETEAKDTEDRVFRLWALGEVGVKGKPLSEATSDLLRTQRSDGGWGQLDRSKSDAYATGTALVALHRAGGLAVSDKAYQRGIAWLLKAQLPDGSWLVRTRSKPIQTYFESGFPHGKHQFISVAASAWAVTALALSLPEATATMMSRR